MNQERSKKVYCLYHRNDLDGWCSGAIVRKRYPMAEMIGWSYGDPYPILELGVPIIMCDISFPMQHMHGYADGAEGDMTWIDHHKSAIKDYDDYRVAGAGEFMKLAVLDTKVAACELTWQTMFPHDKMPESVLLLGEYDTFRKADLVRWHSRILPFQLAMKSMCGAPEEFAQELLSDDEVEISNAVVSLVSHGIYIQAYVYKINQTLARTRSFMFELDGYRGIGVNSPEFSSRLFDSVDSSTYDIMLCFAYSGKDFWNVSLYSDNKEIDVSVIAKRYGGGGHSGAAGFQVVSIYELFSIIKASGEN